MTCIRHAACCRYFVLLLSTRTASQVSSSVSISWSFNKDQTELDHESFQVCQPNLIHTCFEFLCSLTRPDWNRATRSLYVQYERYRNRTRIVPFGACEKLCTSATAEIYPPYMNRSYIQIFDRTNPTTPLWQVDCAAFPGCTYTLDTLSFMVGGANWTKGAQYYIVMEAGTLSANLFCGPKTDPITSTLFSQTCSFRTSIS